MRASGGGMRSLLWQQVIASVVETELVTVNTTEGAAYGASLLAVVGAGRWLDVPSACQETVKITGFCEPVKTDVEISHQSYALYKDLYPSLKDSFRRMG